MDQIKTVQEVDLTEQGQVKLLGAMPGGKFVKTGPLFIVISEMTLPDPMEEGLPDPVMPTLRAGNNTTFDNICKLTVPRLGLARPLAVFCVSDVDNIMAIDIATGDIVLDVQTPATGFTVLTAKVFLSGFFYN